MSEVVLGIEGLTAGYDQAAVIRGLDLTIAAGEVVALLGPNGAGKTTTLRAVSGIVKPMAGRISLDGRDLASVSPSARARSGIAHVPEGRGLFYGLTVAEHFRLGHRGERLDEEIAHEYFPALKELRGRRAKPRSGGSARQAPREGLPIPNARNGWLEGLQFTQQHEGEETTRRYRTFRIRDDNGMSPQPKGGVHHENRDTR